MGNTILNPTRLIMKTGDVTMTHLRTSLMLMLIAMLTSTGCAQEITYPTGLLDRDTVITAAADVTTEAYPNADDVLVDDLIRVRYEADGTATRWDDTIVKILTERGKQDNQSMMFHFTKPYTELEVTLVEVIKPDGTVTAVDLASQGQVMVDPSQMHSNIYNPNAKVYEVGVPDLEIGDLLRYVFVRKTVKPRIPDTWADRELLEYTSPVKHFVYEIDGPSELPLASLALKDEIDGTVDYTTDETDGRVTHRWEVNDVPRIYREPSMPAITMVAQRVRASTVPDWETLSRWYWDLCEPHIDKTTPEMEAKVAELTEGLTDRQAKIEAIFYWAAQQVRYMGITTETDAPGYEPHDVSITFDNKYGVCRDKAALLVAMLRLAGFEAEMVLIHAGDKRDYEVPDPYFNHAIVAVREADGSYQLMDCTNETTKELLPAYLSDKSYLVATEAGTDLQTSAITPAESNLVSAESIGSLSAEGTLTLHTTMRFTGSEDNSLRGYFSRLKPEERRQLIERITKNVVAGATLTDVTITPTNMQDTTTPLVIEFDLVAEDFAISGDQCSLIRSPFLGAELGTAQYLLSYLGLEEREYPLKTGIACGVRETSTIELPQGFASDASMPEFDTISEDSLAWSKSITLEGNTLVGESEFLLKAVEFSPAEYLQLKAHLATIDYNERKMPIFTRSDSDDDRADLITPDDDFILLARDVSFELTDAHNWTERRSMTKKILTHSGREMSAELAIAYNPAWETVTLVSATVTAPDGTVKTVREEEINLMDAMWVSSAPRYPGSKTLMINLPNVEIGSVIDYEVLGECTDRPFFSDEEIFRAYDPNVNKTLSIHAPSDLPLNVRTYNADAISATQHIEGDTTIYTWSINDQTGMTSERMTPPTWAFLPSVVVSTGDWADYATLVDDALEAAVADAPLAAAKAAELVEGLNDDEAKVLAIRDFVARQIRIVGMHAILEPGLDELPLTAITPADQVLTDAYGNATDRAVLMMAMLRASGFDPAFVLCANWQVWDGPDAPYRAIPQMDTFTTVMVRVPVDGQDIYLGDGDHYWALGTTQVHEALGLETGTGELVTIRPPEGKADALGRSYTIALEPNGDATIEQTNQYYGPYFGNRNRQMTELPPEERRRMLLLLASEVAQGATAQGELELDFDAYPGTETFTVAIDQFAVRDGDHLYLTLPEPGSLLRLYLPGTDSREHPLYWAVPQRRTIRVAVELPEEFQTVLLSPPAIDWAAPRDAGTVTVTTTQNADDPSQLIVEYVIDLDAAMIPASDYPELLDIQAKLSHPSARTIVLTRAAE
jgi:transglutaminase-like putative cysteine protease